MVGLGRRGQFQSSSRRSPASPFLTASLFAAPEPLREARHGTVVRPDYGVAAGRAPGGGDRAVGETSQQRQGGHRAEETGRTEEKSEDEDGSKDSEDEEALLSRRLLRILAKKRYQSGRRHFKKGKDLRKSKGKELKKSEPICYECKKPGHIKAECPKLKKTEFRKKDNAKKFRKYKKKAMAAAWDNDSDSDSELPSEDDEQLLFSCRSEDRKKVLSHFSRTAVDATEEGDAKKKRALPERRDIKPIAAGSPVAISCLFFGSCRGEFRGRDLVMPCLDDASSVGPLTCEHRGLTRAAFRGPP
ncbi:hypothetical protein Taro_008763 [Colocasia esculenta]|uniref:CCHC-type domain-containing protein n=1 Tax=Colocasia esculenta TaxID=4460 RepID=A0A843TY55_COLES|nr:hypothetical protein [Colocasia esculenta]